MKTKGFNHRYTSEEAGAFNSQGIKDAKSRRRLREREEAFTKQVVAMLFYGDEPTGDVESMLLIELFTKNKAFRAEFFDAPEGERMYEWRYKSRAAKSNQARRERNEAKFMANPNIEDLPK